MNNLRRAYWKREQRRKHKAMLNEQHNIAVTHRAQDLAVWRRDNMTIVELTRQPTFRAWFAAEGLGEWRDDFESDPERFRLEMNKVQHWLYDHPCAVLPWL